MTEWDMESWWPGLPVGQYYKVVYKLTLVASWPDGWHYKDRLT